MHPTVRALVLFGLVAALGAGCASTRSPSSQIEDFSILVAVKTKLAADPEINPFRIDVDVVDGVVRLSGAVEKRQAKREAARLTKRTQGVRKVINDLRIGRTSFGQRLDDATLEARVKGRFAADPEVAARNIKVDVEGGVVVLTGKVSSRAEKRAAADLALATAGIWRVRNLLEIVDR